MNRSPWSVACNKESDSVFDVWLLTAFKCHHFPFSYCPTCEQAKKVQVPPALAHMGSSNFVILVHMGILTLISPPPYHKTPNKFVLSALLVIFKPDWETSALSPEIPILWVISLLLPTWLMCVFISQKSWTKFGNEGPFLLCGWLQRVTHYVPDLETKFYSLNEFPLFLRENWCSGSPANSTHLIYRRAWMRSRFHHGDIFQTHIIYLNRTLKSECTKVNYIEGVLTLYKRI